MTKFLLIVDYSPGAVETPMLEWDPADIKAHMDYYRDLNHQLTESGELLDVAALTWPDQMKKVTSDGVTAPVVTDGPFPESKELLAGYQLVDVESEERALEIAALVSQVPGPGGVPLQQPITVRRVMGPADIEEFNPLD
ncbi:hypothetical protein FB561_6697 [Kribbella amoyensis]|uniref:YCII-related domain-containing protein n=1 Tax=Kribbella amoyensis TaxID=996641 RepID=A0A561B8Y7_9ACTN|nr:YciI family protein [Kribbella amoyensis]TWD75259.1 hypothetical protein FB561_6697 [Kribbella amoyensis]